jgi:hypothetical protein
VPLVVLSVLLLASPAAAGPYDWGYLGGSDPTRAPDSRGHSHCKDHFDLHASELNAAMSQLEDQTVMWRVDAASCTSATDVVWIKTDLYGIDGGELAAKTVCASHVSWGVCEQHWVLIDQPLHYVLANTGAYGGSDPGGWYSLNLQKTMRHHVGRTAGLHPHTGSLSSTFGAMNQAWVPNGTSGWLTYLAYQPFQVDLIDGNV